MQRRKLGQTGVEVGRIGLGCVTFGREIDQAASFDVLDAALDAGIHFFDTAEAYGGGQAHEYRRNQLGVDDSREVTTEMHSSELILGRWLAQRKPDRSRIVLQSKLLPPLTRSRIHQTIDASLQRLRVDMIDFFLAHAFDPQTPLEETLRAFEEVKQAGKIRFAGCSNFSAEQIDQSLRLHEGGGKAARLEVVQSNYNLAVRDIEAELLPLCRARGVGAQTYSPLGAGFLTGKYRAGGDLPQGSRFHIAPGHAEIYFQPDKFAALDRLQRLSQRVAIPITKLAMAWVLSRPEVDVMLIGARHAGQVQAAVEAAQLSLPPAWIAELNKSRDGA